MMKQFLLLTIFILFSPNLQAQFNDLIWEFGYKPCTTCFDRKEMNFSTGEPVLSVRPGQSNIQGFNAAYILEDSSLYCFSNGNQVFNKEYELMDNSELINPGYFKEQGETYGRVRGQTGYFLRHPTSDSILYLIHTDLGSSLTLGAVLNVWMYTEIDMNANNGLGRVVSENNVLLESINISMSAATKHANGRDWWLITADGMENRYFKILLNENGFSSVGTQYIGHKYVALEEQTPTGKLFSPDGSKYLDWDSARGFSLFDFDRCTGELSNEDRVDFEQFTEPFTGWGYGYDPEFSKNGRFIYNNTIFTKDFKQYPYLLQYDLEAPDLGLSADTLAKTDTFFLELPWWGADIQEAFAGFTLAPDGRIYVFGNRPYLHIIAHPNRKGTACDFRKRAINLETNNKGNPYTPNFRLGPLDNTTCDTLGLDNHPLATFRYDVEDTLSPLQVSFTDLSYYEPETWSWDFDGLGMSSDTNPIFTFPAAGVYEVCMTVCNQNSCDTMCRMLTLGTTSVQSAGIAEEGATFALFPNPFTDFVHISAMESFSMESVFVLTDITGRPFFSKKMNPHTSTWQIDLENLPRGLYFYKIQNQEGFSLQSGKLIKE